MTDLQKPEPARSAVLASFDDGVDAIASVGNLVTDWSSPTPCPDWTASDLAGHLLSIARYYHRLLDSTLAGAPIDGLPRGDDLAAMNAADLGRLEASGGAERISEFAGLAHSYGARLADLGESGWDLTLGIWSGLGPLTVGQHTGVAIGEWHVHAWDLAAACGREHRPADPGVVAAGQRVIGRIFTDDGEPWTLVLVGYGRALPGDS